VGARAYFNISELVEFHFLPVQRYGGHDIECKREGAPSVFK
jgi:hypothetical protein